LRLASVHSLSLVALCLLVLPAFCGPAEAVALASADARRLDPKAARHTRYLSLYNLPSAKARTDAARLLSFHVNSLSRESDITRPQPVDAGDLLLRINLDDYGLDPDVWEQLANVEPFFTVRVKEVVVSVVRTKKGRKKRKQKQIVKNAAAPWLAQTPGQKAALAALVDATGSQVPVVRGDWFFYQTSIQIAGADKNPRYYQFLKLKNRADFEKLIAFNQIESRKFVQPLLAAIANSGVAIRPRRVERDEKVGGGYWQTKDNKQAVDKNNPLRALNGGFRFDAQEFYGHLPNGLWAMFLADKDGNAQDSAPDFVGHDKTTTSNDGRIHVYMSCARCHTNGGLQDLDDYARYLFRPPLSLQSVDYDVLKKLRQQYLRDLLPRMTADRLRYGNALWQANGLTSRENARLVKRFWREWVDTPVGLVQAGRELGVPPEKFRAALDRLLRSTGSVDTVLATYLRDPRQRIPRDQWNEAYALAQFALAGQVPAEVVRPEKDDVLRGFK
jgi:hypothetical protein